MDNDYTNFWDKKIIGSGVGMTGIPHGTVKFLATDSLENFKKNPKSNYTVDSIDYTFNYWGFRTMDFNEAISNGKKNILCLGCSYTVGVGLQNEYIWPVNLQKYFSDHNVLNLGISGSSGDAVARLLYITLDFFQPETVFILWPEIVRVEDYTTRGQTFAPTTIGTWEFNKQLYSFIQGDDHYLNVRRRNLALVELLQHKYKFKLVELGSNKYAACDHVKGTNEIFDDNPHLYDFGRDRHPGSIWHKTVAQEFINQYERQYLGR